MKSSQSEGGGGDATGSDRGSATGGEPRVAVFVDMLSEYGRDILGGVSDYIRTHRPWVVFGDPERVVAPVQRMSEWDGDGIIAHVGDPALLESIRASGLPVVNVSSMLLVEGGEGGTPFASVLPDNAAVARLAAEHLLDRGFQAFGFCGFTGHPYSVLRGRAFERRLEEAGHACSFYESRPPQEAGQWDRLQAELAEWVASLPKPTAIMGCNDARTRHVAQVCHAASIRVPEDVALIGADNDELVCEMSNPPLSSVDLSAQRVGYEAAALLERLMAGETPPPTPLIVPPAGVVVRRSSDILAIADPDVADALRFIHERFAKQIGVDDVVAVTSVSRRVLERRFAEHLQSTIHKRIAAARLARAKALLIHTDLPAADVADRCGFGYVQQFNTLFKREQGMTPTRYRREHRNL